MSGNFLASLGWVGCILLCVSRAEMEHRCANTRHTRLASPHPHASLVEHSTAHTMHTMHTSVPWLGLYGLRRFPPRGLGAWYAMRSTEPERTAVPGHARQDALRHSQYQTPYRPTNSPYRPMLYIRSTKKKNYNYASATPERKRKKTHCWYKVYYGGCIFWYLISRCMRALRICYAICSTDVT